MIWSERASQLRMKKLLLLSSVLMGAIPASWAGVHVSVGIGLPIPPLPRVIISAPAPVVVAPAPPPCEAGPPVVVAPPPVVVAPPGYYYYPRYYPYRYGYYPHPRWERAHAYRH